MKKSQKILALVLSLVLVLAIAVPAAAEFDYAANAKVVYSDFSGKTVILHSNDVHGALEGYAAMSALRATFEMSGAEVILVDAGDFSQGTIYVSSNKGASAVTMMNAVGYDFVTLGNHEFDFGYEQLKKNLERANFTVLCADVYLDETGETIYPADAVFETESGVKIGFFGMETPETATKVNPGLISEISFATFDDLYASAQVAVDDLREQEADLVFGIVHLGVDDESAGNGYRSLDLYDNVNGVDFLIDGHSHTVMTSGPNGEPIQSTGTAFANIGVIVIDNETKTIEDNFLMNTAGLSRNALIASKANGIIETVDAEYNTPFATSEVLLNGERAPGNRTEQTNLGSLITDAMVWSVVSAGGVASYYDAPVVGVTNGGGIRATIQPGEVTKKDINTVLPFGNTVAVVYVTGAELLEALEASTFCTPDAVGGYPQTSGIEWVLDTSVAFDQGEVYALDGKESSYYAPASIGRVTIKSINGEAFDENATYAVVTNNFCAAGGDTYNVFNRAYVQGFGFDTGIPMDEAVMDYVAEVLNGTIGQEYAEPSAMATQIG
jgi:5'-nucleotidase